MHVPQIKIQTTDIKVNYQITDPVQHIKQPKAIITMEQPAAIVEINTTNSQMQTDMTRFYNDLGYKKTGQLISEFAQKGKQAVMEDISKRANQGRKLMLSAGKGQENAPIKSIIKQNTALPMPQISNIRFIPSYNSIDISFTKGGVDINIQPQEVKQDVQVNKPFIYFQPGDVTGRMVQRPNIEIDVQI